MMINKIRIPKMLAFALIPLLFVGCDDLFDDGEITYDGPAQVEFQPLSQSFTLTQEEAGFTTVNVQLIGEQRDQALPLSLSVVPNESEALQAQEDIHYTLPNTSVTIPADSSSATFEVGITGENLQAGEQVQLSIELQGSGDVQAAENLKTYTLNITGGG